MNAPGSLLAGIARKLLKDPPDIQKKGREWRYGKNGSLSVNVVDGTWKNFETNEGGGYLDFIVCYGGGGDHKTAKQWLVDNGFSEPPRPVGGHVAREATAPPKTDRVRTKGFVHKRLGRPAKIYEYRDENGKLRHLVCRFVPKNFRQCQPDPENEGFVFWDMVGVRRVLYRLPELLEGIAEQSTVIIAEGEKDCDNLAAEGFVATTCAEGAQKWSDEYNATFKGVDVVLTPDNDDAGRKHMESIAAALKPIAKRVRILDIAKNWPECPEKGDVSDWFEKGGGTAERLIEIARQTPDWEPPKPSPKPVSSLEMSADEIFLLELAKLDPLAYGRRRRQAAKELGNIPVKTLDILVAQRKAEIEQKVSPSLCPHWAVAQWNYEVPAGALISALMERIRRHVIMSEDQAAAAALWIMLTWIHEEAAVHSPILLVTSPERDSGKSTLLGVVGFLVRRSLLSVDPSGPALFRSIAKWGPTFVIDEADTLLLKNEDLSGVVNSGWTRGQGVIRINPDTLEPEMFSTFSPKVLGMKGRALPDTTLSRSVVIEMKPKRPGDKIKDFYHIDDEGLAELRGQCFRWAADNAEALAKAQPEMVAGFHNRTAANWKLLLAIAESAGGDWKQRAWKAAQSIEGVRATFDTSYGVELLSNIKTVFEEKKLTYPCLSTADLLDALNGNAEWAWATVNKGKPLDDRGLSRRLKPYGVRPGVVHPTGESTVSARGYKLADLEEPFALYLKKSVRQGESGNPEVHAYTSNDTSGLSHSGHTYTNPPVYTYENGEKPNENGDVYACTSGKPGNGPPCSFDPTSGALPGEARTPSEVDNSSANNFGGLPRVNGTSILGSGDGLVDGVI